MEYMTLREIYSAYNISRRAIQGYEKAGLVLASRKNERGHLLYDENAQERIKQIKLFQQMGFTIKEIKEIIDAPDDILVSALEEQIKILESKKQDTEIAIASAHALIQKKRNMAG